MALAALIVRIGADFTGLNKAVSQAEKDVQKVGRQFSKIGGSLTKNLSVPIVGIGAAFAAAAVKVGTFADELLDLADMTGLSTRTLQEFRHVALVAGVGADTLADAAIKLTTKLSSGGEQTKQLSDALARLGLKATDANGRLVSMDTLLPNIIGRLQGMSDVTLRNTIAADVFGKSWAELAPVISLSAGEMKSAREEAERLGLVMSDDALKAANDFRIKVDTLKSSAGALTREFGVAVIPIIEKFVGLVSAHVVPAVRNLVTGFGQLSPVTKATIGAVAGLAAALGPLLLIFGKLLTMLPLIRLAFTALLGPVGLVVAGLALVTTALIKSGSEAQKAKQDVLDFKKALEGLGESDLKLKTIGYQKRIDLLMAEKKLLQDVVAADKGTGFGKKGSTLKASARIGEIDTAIETLSGKLVSIGQAFGAASKTIADAAGGDGNSGVISDTAKKIASQMQELFDRISVGFAEAIADARNAIFAEGERIGKRMLTPESLFPNAPSFSDALRTPGSKPPSKLELAAAEAEFKRSQEEKGKPKTQDSLGTKVSQVLGAGMGGSEMGQMVQAFASFGPMAAILPVINGAMEKLGPAFTKLIQPLVEVGAVIGEAIAPVLEALAPVVKLITSLLSVGLAPVLRIITTVLSYVVEAFGWLIKGLGTFIDKIVPDWISKIGKSLAQQGQDIIDSARAARRNASATDEATEAVNKFASALSNVPRVLNVNALRHMVTGATPGEPTGGGGAGSPRGGPGKGPVIANYYGDTYITVDGSVDPERTANAVGRAIERTRTRGGVSRIQLAVT